MIDKGKHSVLGVNIHAVDYESAVQTIKTAAIENRPCSVSALAVHGVMTGFHDKYHLRRLNGLDLVVPDGQPVRWALNLLYGIYLPDRVYGPNLTLDVIKSCSTAGLPIYVYGSTASVIEKFTSNLKQWFPSLIIAGTEPSKFRRLNEAERKETVDRIKKSGARLVIVGLGCPRQEVWAFEFRNDLQMPILAVGAAFDFHAGTLKQAPKIMQDLGLEWLFRLIQEPKRLWRRYIYLNPEFIFQLCLQLLKIKSFPAYYPDSSVPTERYG